MPLPDTATQRQRSLGPGWPRVRYGVLAAALCVGVFASVSAGAQVPDLDRLGVEASLVRQHWTNEDGLPVDAVNHIAQTADGYLWIATYDGLVRFDGVRFTAYRAGDHEGITSNRIMRLAADRDGTLWIVDAQRHLIRHRQGTFTHVDRLGDEGGLVVSEIETGPDGRVWFATNRGLARTASPDAQAPLVQVPLGVTEDDTAVAALTLWFEAAGALWVGTRRAGLLRVAADGAVARRARWPYVRALHWEDGVLQAQTLDAMHYVPDVGPPAPTRMGLGSGLGALTFFRTNDDAEHLWTTTYGALFRDGQEVFRASSRISALLHDREGNTWVGTARNGLYRLRPTGLRMLGTPEGLGSDNVYPVLQARSGAVWAGGINGRLSRVAGDRITTRTSPVAYVWSLHEDRSGALWVGGAGLCVIEAPEEGGPCRSDGVPAALQPKSGRYVRAIYEDAAENLWAGTHAGLFRRRAGCRGPTCWDRLDSGSAILDRGIVRVFHERPDGTLWMGTSGSGLVRHARGVLDTLSTADGLPSDNVRALYEDPQGVLWVGTEDAGLARIDPRETSDLSAMPVTVYRNADGLFDDGIHQILPDDQGRLWMSTNRGLFWVSHDDLEAFHRGATDRIRSTSYDEFDGLRDREANGGMQPAGMRDTEGRMWFPTQAGIAVIDPSALNLNEEPPPVVIEHVGPDGARRPVETGTPISLGADERSFVIGYTAPSFVDPDEVRFEYRLDGFDRDWVEAGPRRQAFYTNVPPGAYTFRVRARNGDGVRSEETAAVAVTVAPFVYETWWFRSLGAGLLLALAIGVFRARARKAEAQRRLLQRTVDQQTRSIRDQNDRLARQAERLQEMDRLKSRFFTNVSHEFRTPLTLTIGPLEDLHREEDASLPSGAQKKVGLALRNSRRLLRLINQLLDIAKLEAGELRLDARPGDLAAFVGRVARAFVPLAERRRVRFTVEAPESPMPVRFDAAKLEQVLANLLSNAFKFTPEGGAIQVTVVPDDAANGTAVITVRDNGPGVPVDALPHLFDRFYQADETYSEVQPGTGIGLSLAKDLIELHGGSIAVESGVGFGTTFTVRLPTDAGEGEAPTPESLPRTPPLPSHSDGSSGDGRGGVPPGMAESEEGNAEEPHVDDRTTVLVADDNAEIRGYVRGHLEPHYRVLEAADGTEALALSREEIPDLIVSDVMMPHLDGFGLVRALRADRETDFIPVLLLTARAGENDKVEGLDGGADAYLTKPFSVRELQARIGNLIASRQHLKERFAATPPVPAVPTDGPASPKGTERPSSADDAYVASARAIVEAHLSDEDFGVEELAASLEQSRSTLYRRLRDTLQESPTTFIREVRLERAATLLRERSGTVSEVAYAVGFRSVSHFCQSFRDAYGTTPSAYAEGVPDLDEAG